MDPNTSTFTGPIEPQQIKAASHIKVYALPKLIAAKFGSQQGVPNNTGDQVKFTYWEYFQVTGVAAVEGVTPSSLPLVRKNVTLTLQQYITWTGITDWTQDLHPDNVMKPILKNLATWMAQTIELVTLNALLAGTNVLYAGNVSSRLLVNATVSRNMCARVNEIFELNDAEKITEMVGPSTKIATQPIQECYVALFHPSLQDDVQHCVNYIPVRQYGQANSGLPNEVGNVEGVRFCYTRFLKPYSAAATSVVGQVTFRSAGTDTAINGTGYADVYPIIFLAKEAFGCANLNQTKSGQVLLKKPGVADTGDPAGQRGTAAIKFYFGATILADLYLIRGEVACTNPSSQAY
jgi:N4-gp56 family major capsid protein